MSDTEILFCDGDLNATLENCDRKVLSLIESRTEEYILNVNEEEYMKHLYIESRIEPLELIVEGLHMTDKGEAEVELYDYGQVYRAKRPYMNFALPFRGEPILFKLRPNTFHMNPPRARIAGQQLCWRSVPNHNSSPEQLKAGIDSFIQSINQFIGWQHTTIVDWNSRLEGKIRAAFKARKERLLKNANFVAALGIPMKKRNDPSGSYSVPVAPKKIASTPKASTTNFEPHPTLTEQDYQEILRHLRHMSHTIERMPDAFQTLDEEQIRTQFLMNLNGAYEGNATGETFSHQGKTDIFLNSKERAIFIAECKFWTGPAAFPAVIDQLLGYLTWRETKTAILLFVRNQDISQVVAQIPGLVSAHASFTRADGMSPDSGEFRFVMKSARDESLPITLTVMVFHLPKATPRTQKGRSLQ